MSNEKLLEATRLLLDLQKEKKDYDKEMNVRIKEVKADIEQMAKENA